MLVAGGAYRAMRVPDLVAALDAAGESGRNAGD
jgi:hypothetical protein